MKGQDKRRVSTIKARARKPRINAGYRLSMRGHRGATAYPVDLYGDVLKIRISPYPHRGVAPIRARPPADSPYRLSLSPYHLSPGSSGASFHARGVFITPCTLFDTHTRRLSGAYLAPIRPTFSPDKVAPSPADQPPPRPYDDKPAPRDTLTDLLVRSVGARRRREGQLIPDRPILCHFDNG